MVRTGRGRGARWRFRYGNLVSKHSLNAGLVSRWIKLPKISNGLYFRDIKGKNDGTLTNGPTWGGAMGRPGGFGSLAFATASNQYVSIPQTSSLNLGSTFFFSCWIRPTSLASYRTLIDSTARDFSIFIDTTANGGYSRNGGFSGVTFSPAWTLNEWQHIAWRGTPSNNFFYRNGVQCATDTNDVDSVVMNSAWHLGGNPSGGGSPWDGAIDDVLMIPGVDPGVDFIRRIINESYGRYPQTLNRVRTYTVFDVGGGAPAGNRRRRVICGATA